MAVRTKRLPVGQTFGAAALYTTPVGHTGIVKWCSFHNGGAASCTFDLTVSIGPNERIVRRMVLDANVSLVFESYWVLQPNDGLVLRLRAGPGPVDYHISGSELLGVA